MVENVNEKILDKIKSSDISVEIKDFLKKMLFLEFQHSEESRWRYSNDYEKNIKYFAGKYQVKEE